MSKMIYLLHFLLLNSICHQFCKSQPLTNDSAFSNVLANVEKSLQQALHYIYRGKVSESYFQSENVDDGLSIKESKTEYHFLLPSNCLEIQLRHATRKNGIYNIYPKGRINPTPFQVYCDMKTVGGGWTVFQRRDDFGEPRENFFRNWTDYKNGFGSLNKEFWLGNDHITILTLQDRMTLRIDLEGFDGDVVFAEYSNFRMKGEAYNYRISFDEFRGNTYDSLSYHVNRNFATYDRDNEHNCSKSRKGGWWYNNCYHGNLNGIYLMSSKHETNCTSWRNLKEEYHCMKKIEMKLRPQYFIDKESVDSL